MRQARHLLTRLHLLELGVIRGNEGPVLGWAPVVLRCSEGTISQKPDQNDGHLYR